ncbi:sulfotransferase family protein [Glycomyces buryatensis]|uniref:Sulfotransferase n=1 Tax=Glycomyces buryatensis TaxID=2570927 RepID=A0A4S8QJB4_9ACTN|nr:sulfotransferase [Glycomyces buryatensis]THV41459.1 sulfotransferase [Glycomyces buryatensis]
MQRTSGTTKMLNILLTPTTLDRRNPAKTWRKMVAAAEADQRSSFDGDRQWLDDLEFAFGCYADVKHLGPIGWASTKSEFSMRMVNRLRVRRLHAEIPAIGNEPIERPVFIVGLPRTATTLTHKILAASEGHRGPLAWEMYNVDLKADPQTDAERIAKLTKDLEMLPKLMPALPYQHPTSATSPEESLLIVPHTAYHLCRAPLPRYREWLDQHDHTTDYGYLKQALQVLQYGRERKRWILKAPFDLFNLGAICKVFPDAKIVWTHRDPMTVMASTCSLIESFWRMALRRTDTHELGETFLTLLSDMVDQARETRHTLPSGAVIDVPYHRLNHDPHTYVPLLYRQLDAKWTAEDAANLDGQLARPANDRKHEYSLSDYGLTHSEVDDAFGDYIKLVSSLN